MSSLGGFSKDLGDPRRSCDVKLKICKSGVDLRDNLFTHYIEEPARVTRELEERLQRSKT
jgi:hypothetical protein